MRTLVIGACNIDIIATSKNSLIKNESNIGEVKIALGGVAKNIVTNLNNLGAEVEFLTLIGKDYFSNLQKDELTKSGIEFSYSFFKDTLSSTYVAINECEGDMEYAVNDMRAFEALTVEDFEPLYDYIDGFDILVFDTNLSEKILTHLIQKYQDKRIYVDGVSQTKVVRIKTVMEHIDFLKINQYELNTLLDKPMCDIILGVKEIVKRGVKNCVVSSSREPITYNIEQNIYQSITHKTRHIKSTLGAGDALFSGIIFYLLNNKNMHEAVNFGKIVASKTLEVYEACNKEIVTLIDL